MKNLNVIHLNGLRAVEVAGRLGSLQAAADELGVTIGAVSQQIIKTERQLGRTLFTRTPRGLVASEFADRFLPRLQAGFEILDQAVGAARKRDEGILTISVAPVFAARWLVARLDRFARHHPDIQLRIDATTRLVSMETSDVDIGIRVGRGDWPGVHAELLLAQEVFPVCSPGMARQLAKPEDILNFPAVIDGHSMFSWETWFREAGLSGRTMGERHVFNEASICLDAAIAGQGPMLAWQTLAGDSLIEGRLVAPFKIRARSGFGHYFVTAPDRRETATVRAFKAWVRAEIAESMKRIDAL
ncbi:LysR substrate-binding domain-containing protein [Pararhizobium arenae]|uniref:LysR substrate-binding domain-containing protein n=1 Tax=Pararhizobium arenae TaxID=1856850 RepID=UPI00094B3906|nr:LysR substrate-binding domain-containing protein [Pararhizobium arenae]